MRRDKVLIFSGRGWSVGLGFLTNVAVYMRSNGTFVNFGIGQLRIWNR